VEICFLSLAWLAQSPFSALNGSWSQFREMEPTAIFPILTTNKQHKSQHRTTPMAGKTTAGDVLVYIPNLIGYLRVALTLTSIVLMICYPGYWVIAIAFYLASFVGDLFDGMAARKFDQCSSFGGLIDMVTDRCSTAGLLCVLSREYSNEPTLVLVRRCCMHYCVLARLKSLPVWCALVNVSHHHHHLLVSAFHDAHNTGYL